MLIIELEIKDTSYSFLHIETESESKRDYFSFHIVNFPFLCSSIPAAPAYGVYTCQYSRDRVSYQDVLDRGLLLTTKY